MAFKVVINGIDTNKLPRLSHAESTELLRQIKDGDKVAREYFITCNLRLVLSVMQRYNGKGAADDLFQVGCVGLMKALNNFDLKYNVQFSTYAVPMIIGEIRRFLKEESSIKVSRSMRDTACRALRAKEQLERECEYHPSIERIAELIGSPMRDVAAALDAVSRPISLYEPVYNDGEDTLLLMEQLCDVDANEESLAERSSLEDAIKLLPDKERMILDLRYFIGKTQVEISTEVGISQAQVSRLEKSALDRLRLALA